MKSPFKILSLVFTVLCIWAALLQYNDPDAFLWYAIYGVGALASLLFFFKRLPFLLAIALCIAYFTGMILCWPETFEGLGLADGDIRNIEQGREALGLFILSLIMLFYGLIIRAGR